MTDSTPPANPVEEFEAGKIIFETLKGLSRDRQERVLRWVAEALGISAAAILNPPTPTPPAAPATPPATPQQGQQHTATDIKSFIQEKKPRSDNQFVTAVAHFYRFDAPQAQRRQTIDADFVREAIRLVNWKRMGNPLKTLNNAVNRGYLDRSERGQFAISTVGENLVARILPGGGGEENSKKGRATKNKKKKKTGK
jgi:hypothetical protein